MERDLPSDGACVDLEITEDQKKRAQRNKERALALKEQRRRAKPYDRQEGGGGTLARAAPSSSRDPFPKQPAVPAPSRNSYAGFMYEEEELAQHRYRLVEEDAPAAPDEMMLCEECSKPFAESYLYSKFRLDVCDKCRDPKGKHSLITKTEAKKKYLLQDCDFEERLGAPLRFLLKKNPHSSMWGEMKLYLLCQVESRAHEIWGGEDGLRDEHVKRNEVREKRQQKKYAKEIKALRRSVKTRLPENSHVHTYPVGEETYDSESDTWTKTCADCGFQVTFEKM